MEKRSATDILLSIEAKLSELDGRIKNTEFLHKTIMKKLTILTQQNKETPANQPKPIPTAPVVINKDNFETRPSTDNFSKIAAQHGIMVDEGGSGTLINQKPQSPLKPSSDDLVETKARSSPVRGQRGPVSDKKYPVSQVLTHENDRPLFLANVEIMNSEGTDVISKTRTNATGRWLATLAPGSYQVHVLKNFPPDSGRESIDTSYKIDVVPSDGPTELNSLLINNDK